MNMNEPKPADQPLPASPEEMTSALFANMVVQQTNMALMFLGRVPHPESGQHILDLDAARMFIDQLEMLEAKTKGNLDKRETTLLKQSLTALRMAFVEAANQEPAPDTKKEAVGAGAGASSGAAQPASPTAGGGAPSVFEPGASTADAESRKKFSKKY